MFLKGIVLLVGFVCLIKGADFFVDGSAALAAIFRVPGLVIGLTIVAGGTSLPELATSIIAAVKNQPGLAVGNVIGSNIFNILLVLGTAATVAPLPFRGVTRVDLWTLMGASIMFLVFARAFRHRCITRPEGVVMLVAYIAYMVWLVIAQ